MRAIQVRAFGGPQVLQMVELPEPAPGPGEVTVAVAVAPVLSLDTQIRAGQARDWFPPPPPYVPGSGAAGQVAATGPGVDASWAGRRVVADTTGRGGYLEQALVPAERLVPVPEGLRSEE